MIVLFIKGSVPTVILFQAKDILFLWFSRTRMRTIESLAAGVGTRARRKSQMKVYSFPAGLEYASAVRVQPAVRLLSFPISARAPETDTRAEKLSHLYSIQINKSSYFANKNDERLPILRMDVSRFREVCQFHRQITLAGRFFGIPAGGATRRSAGPGGWWRPGRWLWGRAGGVWRSNPGRCANWRARCWDPPSRP